MNKSKLFKSIYFNIFLTILHLYAFLGVVKSLVILILMYTDKRYYNWNFIGVATVEEIINIQIYILVIPVLLLLALSFYFKKILNLKKQFYIPSLLISILIFRFLDIKIRQLFIFTDNPRFNDILLLLIFSLLFFGIYFIRKRIDYNGVD